jgi:hypothetical protein
LRGAVGVESEMELAYAALHELCAPMLDRVVRLPGPQRDALGVAFGLSAGDAPDRLSGRAGGDADVMRYEDVERLHPGAGRVLVQVAGTSFEPVRRRTPLRLRPGNVNSGRVR